MHLSAYAVRLAVAALVAALSLVSDSVEGVMASMLISPVGGPLTSIAPALVAGNFDMASSSLIASGASIVAAVVVGAVVRVFDGREKATVEMRKRMIPFSVRNAFVFAAVIGSLMSLSALHNQGAGTLEKVGLAIAISILPPAVNAGILFTDAVKRAGLGYEVHTSRPEIVTSLRMTLVNMIGVVAGGLALAFTWPGRS